MKFRLNPRTRETGMFAPGFVAIVLLAVLGFFLVAVPVGGVVVIVYLLVNRDKTKSHPQPPAPVAQNTPPSPASPAAAQTQVLPRRCPQCGQPLSPDTPEGLCPACLLQHGMGTEGPGPANPSFVPPTIDELAKLFPQLEILECLGRGGMGAVYKVRQPRLDRLVALKILAPKKQTDPQFAERFEREARVLARLCHPNIVSIFDSGEVQGRFYLIMEYVEGQTLRQVLRQGKLSASEAVRLVPKICEALQYAHGQGIVHRDIKPENILVDAQGNLKIADFGIAKITGLEPQNLRLTGIRDVMGTPAYMAPEQVENPQSVDHRADIYSLGVVFYEMLTGELPLGKFPLPSKKVPVDVRLDEVVLQSLEKEPARRYQQASQVKTAVENIAETPPPIAPAMAQSQPANSANDHDPVTAPAVALIVAGLWKTGSGALGILALSGVKTWISNFVDLTFVFGAWSSVAITSIVLFQIVPGVLIAFGGFQMLHRRSFAWGTAAAILAVVACSLIGFLAGVWALVILSRPNTKKMFEARAELSSSVNRSKVSGTVALLTALACLASVSLLVAIGSLCATAFPSHAGPANTLSPSELQKASIQEVKGGFRKEIHQSFPLNENGRLAIDNVNGEIQIHAWPSNTVALTAAIHGKTGESVARIKTEMESQADHLVIHTEAPSNNSDSSGWHWFNNIQHSEATVDYTLLVPASIRLEKVTSVNGEIVIDGVTGGITSHTVNGQVTVRHAVNDLKLSTVNGELIAAFDALGSGHAVELNTVNGEIQLDLPAGADATCFAKTVNGSISSQFLELAVKNKFPISSELKGSLGTGSGTVTANTVNGAIEILRHGAGPKAAAK